MIATSQGELSSQALRNTTSSHVEVCLHEGTPVEIAGEITREAVPELVQGYRDAGESLVLRGTPGRPVVVRWR